MVGNGNRTLPIATITIIFEISTAPKINCSTNPGLRPRLRAARSAARQPAPQVKVRGDAKCVTEQLVL